MTIVTPGNTVTQRAESKHTDVDQFKLLLFLIDGDTATEDGDRGGL